MFFFLPLGTNRPCWRVPYATYTLMGLNGLVYLVQVAAPGSLPPGFVPAQATLFTWLLAMFMHGGLWHLGGNLLFLWLFGTIAEDVLGPGLFLFFYFGGDIGATALDVIMSLSVGQAALEAPRVGASGAVAGIMGLAAACFARTTVTVWYIWGWWLFMGWRTGTFDLTARVFVGLWVAFELFGGIAQVAAHRTSGTNHWAHVGGFLLGIGVALGLGLHRRVPREDLVSGRAASTGEYGAYTRTGELERLVEESPEDAEAWHALGRSYEATGRLDRARQAYEKALSLFLSRRQMDQAAGSYAALAEYAPPGGLTAEQEFDLACALEEAGRARLAHGLFVQLASHHPQHPSADTGLIRAGELALGSLNDPGLAREDYQRLLERYPLSQWAALARERLEELGPQAPSPPARSQPPEDSDLRPLGR